MCLQCDVNAQLVCSNILFIEDDAFYKGFHLYVSTLEDDEWPKGWYGLLVINNPTLVFGPDGEVILPYYPNLNYVRKLLNQIHKAGYDPVEYTVLDWLAERAQFYKLFEGVINEKDTE